MRVRALLAPIEAIRCGELLLTTSDSMKEQDKMKVLSHLADRRPLAFGLLALLTWVVLDALILGIATLLLKMPIANPFVQLVGTLSATGILVLIAYRLGWLHKIGLTNPGTWPTWALTLILAFYVALSGFYPYFGELTFDLRSLVSTPEARAILLQSFLVGIVEETVFRGILLYALVRVWGQTRRGLVASVVVQAALFGALHALQVLFGAAPSAALANVLDTFVFGLGLGALVLSVRSLWPAVVLHTVSNSFVLIKGLSSQWIDPVFLGYLGEALFQLPLALLGLWMMLKARSIRQPFAHTAPDWISNRRADAATADGDTR
jgi:membrane protease YdiL (CAAX protease family)